MIDYFEQKDRQQIEINGELYLLQDIYSPTKAERVKGVITPAGFRVVQFSWEFYNDKEAWWDLCIQNPQFLYPFDIERQNRNITIPIY